MTEFKKENVQIKIYAEFPVINKRQVLNHCYIIYRMYKNNQLKLTKITGLIEHTNLVLNEYKICYKSISFCVKIMHWTRIILHTSKININADTQVAFNL